MREDQDQFELDQEEDFQRRKPSRREGSGKRKSSDKGRKAPLPYRIVAWISLIVICFGLGYYGTSMFLNATGKDAGSVDENVVSSREELEERLAGNREDNAAEDLPFSSSRLKVYVPSGDSISSLEISVNPSAVAEDRIRRVISKIGETTETNGFLDSSFGVLHVFRTGDMLYLDMSGEFLETMKAIDERKASILMTSIVRSMVENFDPVSRVKVLIQGNTPPGDLPVNLSVAWQLSSSRSFLNVKGLIS